MKRKSNLYDTVLTYDNLEYCFNILIKSINNKKKLFSYIKYKNCLLIDILEKLHNGTYEFGKYNIFLIKENKYRIIMSEAIHDKIVNYFISYFILLPSFNCLIDSSVATRKNMGSEYAYKLMKKYINKLKYKEEVYALKIDVSKFFYNIDHKVLIDMISRRIKDKKCMSLIKKVIGCTNEDYINDNIIKLINREINKVRKLNINDEEKANRILELKNIPIYYKNKGISIGCFSNQILANFFLNDLDHYIKEVLRCKYYIRYMDDMLILSDDKFFLDKVYKDIVLKLKDIKLDVNKKSNMYRLSNGISFLGYNYIINNNRLIIKYNSNTIKKAKRRLNKLIKIDKVRYVKSFNSYKGYLYRSNTKLKVSMLKRKCKL